MVALLQRHINIHYNNVTMDNLWQKKNLSVNLLALTHMNVDSTILNLTSTLLPLLFTTLQIPLLIVSPRTVANG